MSAHDQHPLDFGPAYRVLKLVGQGAAGVVYLAEQHEPVQRRVALKVLRDGSMSHRMLERFDRERQALGLLSHENVARIFAAGTNRDGQPWFSMEFVDGLPIVAFCDRRELGLRARLELFLQVCGGVQHAHQKGLIHRDLKPANVLVAENETRFVVKVIDFGLARPAETGGPALSTKGLRIGTPEWMSPEQANPGPAALDARTDVYSLGVMLYELVTGSLPFTRDPGGLVQLYRQLRDATPERPSARVARRRPSARLERELVRDLDWIILRAMEKDPAHRYDSPAALAHDIRSYLDGEPVEARPPSTAYRLRKLLRKHRVLAGGIAAVALASTASVVVTLSFVAEAHRRSTEAEHEAARGRANRRRARRAEAEAHRQARELELRNDEFEVLAMQPRFRRVVAAAQALRPPWPSTVPRFVAWLEDSWKPLCADLSRIGTLKQSLDARAERSELSNAQLYLREHIGRLDERIRRFEREELPRIAARRGWAQRVRQLTVDRFAARWRAARAAILRADGTTASRLYGVQRLDLDPQTGLVPIGANPVTKLWEFYHLRSGWAGDVDPARLPIPRHRRNGRIRMSERSGIVFVLVPGGTYVQGASRGDTAATEAELPRQRITLAAFFLARYELTQAQWMRLDPTGKNPSSDQIGPSHPVETVSWSRCNEVLDAAGLMLPTEAQWEYAARAGTKTPWSTGAAERSIEGHVNVADAQGATLRSFDLVADWLDDGYAVHAPVDALLPNPWGFHHMVGNVWEFCADWSTPYGSEVRPGDGLRGAEPSSGRETRGGSYADPPGTARVSVRSTVAPGSSLAVCGVRPARSVQ